MMLEAAQELLSTFDRLPIAQQKEVTKVILRRNLEIDTPAVSDEELILAAEDIFLELDRHEEGNA
jgi:ABC-type transport system involved in cytochrome bd biosynthesis fused ATPase/permease subunit